MPAAQPSDLGARGTVTSGLPSLNGRGRVTSARSIPQYQALQTMELYPLLRNAKEGTDNEYSQSRAAQVATNTKQTPHRLRWTDASMMVDRSVPFSEVVSEVLPPTQYQTPLTELDKRVDSEVARRLRAILSAKLELRQAELAEALMLRCNKSVAAAAAAAAAPVVKDEDVGAAQTKRPWAKKNRTPSSKVFPVASSSSSYPSALFEGGCTQFSLQGERLNDGGDHSMAHTSCQNRSSYLNEILPMIGGETSECVAREPIDRNRDDRYSMDSFAESDDSLGLALVRIRRLKPTTKYNRGIYAGLGPYTYVTSSGRFIIGLKRDSTERRIRPRWCSTKGEGSGYLSYGCMKFGKYSSDLPPHYDPTAKASGLGVSGLPLDHREATSDVNRTELEKVMQVKYGMRLTPAERDEAQRRLQERRKLALEQRRKGMPKSHADSSTSARVDSAAGERAGETSAAGTDAGTAQLMTDFSAHLSPVSRYKEGDLLGGRSDVPTSPPLDGEAAVAPTAKAGNAALSFSRSSASVPSLAGRTLTSAEGRKIRRVHFAAEQDKKGGCVSDSAPNSSSGISLGSKGSNNRNDAPGRKPGGGGHHSAGGTGLITDFGHSDENSTYPYGAVESSAFVSEGEIGSFSTDGCHLPHIAVPPEGERNGSGHLISSAERNPNGRYKIENQPHKKSRPGSDEAGNDGAGRDKKDSGKGRRRRTRRRADGTIELLSDGDDADNAALEAFLVAFPESETHVRLRKEAKGILADLDLLEDSGCFDSAVFANVPDFLGGGDRDSYRFRRRTAQEVLATEGDEVNGCRRPTIHGFLLSEEELVNKFRLEAAEEFSALVSERDQLREDVRAQHALVEALSTDVKHLSFGTDDVDSDAFAMALTVEVNQFAKAHGLSMNELLQVDSDVSFQVADTFLHRFAVERSGVHHVACQVSDEDLGYVDDGVRAVESQMEDLFFHEKGLMDSIKLTTVAVANIMNFYTALELESTCKQCFYIFRSPRTLWPCGHTFCQRCLAEMYNDNEELICAECGSLCEVGYTPNLSIELVANYQVLQNANPDDGTPESPTRAPNNRTAPPTIEGVLRQLLNDIVATQVY